MMNSSFIDQSSQSIFHLTILAGFPASNTASSSKDLVTTEPATTTDPRLIRTPGKIITLAATQTSSSITTSAVTLLESTILWKLASSIITCNRNSVSSDNFLVGEQSKPWAYKCVPNYQTSTLSYAYSRATAIDPCKLMAISSLLG